MSKWRAETLTLFLRTVTCPRTGGFYHPHLRNQNGLYSVLTNVVITFCASVF